MLPVPKGKAGDQNKYFQLGGWMARQFFDFHSEC